VDALAALQLDSEFPERLLNKYVATVLEMRSHFICNPPFERQRWGKRRRAAATQEALGVVCSLKNATRGFADYHPGQERVNRILHDLQAGANTGVLSPAAAHHIMIWAGSHSRLTLAPSGELHVPQPCLSTGGFMDAVWTESRHATYKRGHPKWTRPSIS
jgi:hypothetical protein